MVFQEGNLVFTLVTKLGGITGKKVFGCQDDLAVNKPFVKII
jgi:hypothetical protein